VKEGVTTREEDDERRRSVTRGQPPSTADSGLFTRQASGLVPELGILAASGISLASVGVVACFINFNASLTAFSKSELYLPLLVGAGIWLEMAPQIGGLQCSIRRG
jgi:hypothetical protein